MFSESRHDCIDIRAAAAASEPLQKLMSDTSRPLILIVDDDGDLRELLATIFQNDGYCVSRAGDGLEAIEKALRLSPSLIVMDLSLPRLDGCSAIRLLKGD